MNRTIQEAVARLEALSGDDGEEDHDAADKILLEAVPTEVREAYERLVKRAEFWATA